MNDEQLENETPENEGEQDTTPENESELKKSKEAYENQKVRAEKAEKKLKELEAKSAKVEKPETPKTEEQSNEPDYAKLAFLEGKKVNHPDDVKAVMDEAERLKLPLTDVLGMEHIKSQLKDAKDQRDAEGGMPEGGKGKGGGGTKGSVAYWKDKKNKDGTYATPPDPKLHSEVIKARTENSGSNKMFDDSLD